MRFTGYSFGSIRVDGVTYDHDLMCPRQRRIAKSERFVAMTFAPTVARRTSS